MTIKSPCIQVCVMDDESGLCHGCARSLTEIAQWSSYSDAERASILADIDNRMLEYFGIDRQTTSA